MYEDYIYIERTDKEIRDEEIKKKEAEDNYEYYSDSD